MQPAVIAVGLSPDYAESPSKQGGNISREGWTWHKSRPKHFPEKEKTLGFYLPEKAGCWLLFYIQPFGWRMGLHEDPLWEILAGSFTEGLSCACFNFLLPFPIPCSTAVAHLASLRVSSDSVESLPGFLPFISKNICWNTSCGSRGLSNHTLKTEYDSLSSAGSVMMSPFLSKKSLNCHIIKKSWTPTPAILSVWDRSWAYSLMTCNFCIPNILWKSIKVTAPNFCMKGLRPCVTGRRDTCKTGGTCLEPVSGSALPCLV